MFSRHDPVIYIVIIYVVIVLDFLFLARTWRRGVGVAVVQNTLPPIQRCTCTELARNCSFVVCLSSLDEDHHRAAGVPHNMDVAHPTFIRVLCGSTSSGTRWTPLDR